MTIAQIEIQRELFDSTKATGWVKLVNGNEVILTQAKIDELIQDPSNEKHYKILNNWYDLLPEK